MPTFRDRYWAPDSQWQQKKLKALAAELVVEFDDTNVCRQPMILEVDLAGSRVPGSRCCFNTTVVWDQWCDLPGPLRPDLIHNAYELTRRDEEACVKSAVGLTIAEAIDQSLLPFRITIEKKWFNDLSEEEYRFTVSAAASGLPGVWDGQRVLCFPYRHMAYLALQAMEKRGLKGLSVSQA